MKEKKTIGFHFAALAGVLGIVSMVRFLLWAPAHNSMDAVIVITLIAGVILDVVLYIKDNSFILIASVVCYTIAGVKLLTDSVGSFVDAFQGIQMFGDSTQVGTIISIVVLMMISVLLSIISSFTTRTK